MTDLKKHLRRTVIKIITINNQLILIIISPFLYVSYPYFRKLKLELHLVGFIFHNLTPTFILTDLRFEMFLFSQTLSAKHLDYFVTIDWLLCKSRNHSLRWTSKKSCTKWIKTQLSLIFQS